MCVLPSRSFWTSSSLDVPAGVTQEEGHTGFLIHLLSAMRALIFIARRIQPFLSLVDREVEFCLLTIQQIVLHPLGIFNPFKCHGEFFLSLQPMIPPNKRFDISPPNWGMLRRSRWVQIFFKELHKQ